MSMHEKICRAAAEEGYEYAHGEESWGQTSFGLMIFVKMSERKVSRDLDGLTFYKAAEVIKDGLGVVSAKLDPEGEAMRARYMGEIGRIYTDAGVGIIYVEAIPNGYCSKPCCLNRPWARVTSHIGHVVIGWRKNVMSIDWKDSRIKRSGRDIFPDEDVTSWETGIHAWGTKKATDYIRALHAISEGP